MRKALSAAVSLLFCLFLLSACGGGGGGSAIIIPVSNTSWAYPGVAGASRQVTVTWTAASKSTGKPTYNLYWSTKPGVSRQNGEKIENVTSPYIHTGLNNGAMYYYVVTAVTGGVEGSESLEVATAPKAALPLVPTGVTVSPSNAGVQLKIDRTGYAANTRFNLYWSTSSDLGAPTVIKNAFGSGSTFMHSGLKNGVTCYYAVSAETADGETARSLTVAATPLADISASNYVVDVSPARIAAPNAVTAVAASQQATLSWNMPASQIPTVFDPSATPTMPPVISSYTVYWSTAFISDPAKANRITVPVGAKTKLPITFVHNTGLSNKTPYYYLVTAVADSDANGNPLRTADNLPLIFESPAGSQVSVTPEAKAPAPPTGFSATSGAQKITLAWAKGASANITYSIYSSKVMPARPEDMVAAANLIATTAATTYTHSGLQNGATYYYLITATTTGESGPSSIISVKLF